MQRSEEENKCVRPPSSYGSLHSDVEEEGNEEESAEPCPPQFPVLLPVLTEYEGTGYCVLC